MGETSIPCREETRDRLDNLRGEEYRNWDAFLNHLADVWEDGNGGDATVRDLDTLASSVETIETRTGRIERQLDELGGRGR